MKLVEELQAYIFRSRYSWRKLKIIR